MRTLRWILLGSLSLILVAPAEAQERRPGLREVHKHSGFWLSGGLGGGWEDADLSFGNRGRGAAAYIRLGGTVNPRVLFGAEILGWGTGDDVDDIARANVTASALVYPSLGGGLFFKGGFGVAGFERHGFDAEGIATTFGTGFDFRVGRNLYVTPNIDYMVQFFDDSTVGSLLFTVGLTIH